MNKTRVLIVDDEVNVARLTAIILQRSNRYDVKIETFPARALETVRAFRPELVLLDMKMPGKNGTDVLKELREDAELASIPVVFLSSLLDNFEAAKQPLVQPRIRFIAKSVDSVTLLRCVDETVGLSQSALAN